MFFCPPDDYCSGETNKKQMVKKTRWFWGTGQFCDLIWRKLLGVFIGGYQKWREFRRRTTTIISNEMIKDPFYDRYMVKLHIQLLNQCLWSLIGHVLNFDPRKLNHQKSTSWLLLRRDLIIKNQVKQKLHGSGAPDADLVFLKIYEP